MKNKKWLPLIVLLITAVGFLIIGPLKRTMNRGLHVPTPNQHGGYPQTSRGTTIISQTDWRGVPSIQPGKRTEWKMLTPDTWWQVRLDQDDTKVFDCYPANWKNGSYLELPDSNIVEWRIKPGQSITSATVAWEILDRR